MPVIEILPTSVEHLRVLSENLRTEDAHEITCLGLSEYKGVWRSYKQSVWCRSAFVEGELGAVWGVGGSILGGVGQPWLLTTPVSETISPLQFARLYRREVEEMLDIFPLLVNYVTASYSKSVRLLRLVGFELSEPEPIGKNKTLFRRFEMRG